MPKASKVFFDLEATGFSPVNTNIITIAKYVTDADYNILGEFYGTATVGKQRYVKNLRGQEIDLWNPEKSDKQYKTPEEVHGISWKEQLTFDEPIDMYRKMWKFYQQWPNDDLTMIYHSNTDYDPKHLFYHSNIHAPQMYRYLSRRFSKFSHVTDPGKSEGEYITSWKAEDTMRMAQQLIRKGKDYFKASDKLQKKIDRINGYLTKPRKTPAKPAKIAEWEHQLKSVKAEMGSLDSVDVTLEGYSLDKICNSLDIQLDHHNARSDAKALIPIHKFLSSQLH